MPNHSDREECVLHTRPGSPASSFLKTLAGGLFSMALLKDPGKRFSGLINYIQAKTESHVRDSSVEGFTLSCIVASCQQSQPPRTDIYIYIYM